MIDGRKARIARDLDEATAMQQRADAAAAAHEKTLAEARAKAQSLAQAARDAAAADAQAKRKRARGRARRQARRRRARRSRRRAPQAMANVADIARDAAGAIVERLAGARPIRRRSPPRSIRSSR